jgi:23S rRNA (guanosine2251-2'-O)-methyltransferase
VTGGGAKRSGAVRAGIGPARTGARAQLHPASNRERSLGGEQVEGRQAVRELLLAGRRKVRELWVASDLDDAGVISDILDIAASQRVAVTEVSRRRLDAEARSESPQGVLAKAAPLVETEVDDLLRRVPGNPPFLLAVDGVTDPGNLGALLRSAEGAGVTGVLLPRHRAVHITPTAAKAAAGAIEHLRMAVVGGLPGAMAQARERGIWVVGLDDAADRSLFDLGDLGREAICLVLGAEGAGLSRLVRDRCDLVVSIPMRGRLSSLNVSAAGALACFEVARQRA